MKMIAVLHIVEGMSYFVCKFEAMWPFDVRLQFHDLERIFILFVLPNIYAQEQGWKPLFSK